MAESSFLNYISLTDPIVLGLVAWAWKMGTKITRLEALMELHLKHSETYRGMSLMKDKGDE